MVSAHKCANNATCILSLKTNTLASNMAKLCYGKVFILFSATPHGQWQLSFVGRSSTTNQLRF